MKQVHTLTPSGGNGPEASLPPLAPREGSAWVDPRSDPKPGATRVAPRVAEDASTISELVRLCASGRLYAVERWIREGKPLQVTRPLIRPHERFTTPLVVALQSNQYDLALLLLCNGYRMDLEPRSPLDLALRRRAWAFVDLLLAWGADPTLADPDAVLDTYQLLSMEQFWDLGLDLTRDRSLAYCLSESTRNKPAYGWAKRHHEDPRVADSLALALGEAVREDREKAVALLVWAGADPHHRVPDLRYSWDDDPDADRSSAIELAVMFGHGRFLKYLSPDPDLDDFEELWELVRDPDTLDRLFDLRPPRDWSKAITRNISRLGWWYGDRGDSRACLERIFEHHWGRLSKLEPRECQDLRRNLLKMESGSSFDWLLQKLAKPRHCDERIFAELVRTPAIRERLNRSGLSGLLPPPTVRRTPRRVLHRKPGQPKHQSPNNQEENWFSTLTPEARAAILRNLISREQLYEEVWAEPITRVAERYGVSDVAVAKWCRKLDVPRPGRGYWARKCAGQRVRHLPLPTTTDGRHRYVSRPKPSDRRPAPPTATPGLELFAKPIPVPEVLDPEHPLVAYTRRALADSETQERGIILPRDSSCLDVRVCGPSLQRALRLMNALIRALEHAGFAVGVSAVLDSKGAPCRNSTYAVLQDERIPFSITEATQKVERPPTDEERAEMRRDPWKRGPFYAHRPTGELSLQIEGGPHRERHRRNWSDTKHRRLETCLDSFLRGLLKSAEALKRRRHEAEE